MKNFSSYGQCEFDSHAFGRAKDNLSGIADALACRGGFGGLENNQTQQTEKVTNQQATVQGGTGNSVAIAVGGQDNTSNLEVNNYNADASIIDSVSNGLANLSALSESENAQSAETDNLTVQSLANELASIVANTVPQSVGAQAELLNGASPLDTSGENAGIATAGAKWDTFTDIAVVAGTVLTLFVFLRTKGKST